MVKYDLTLYVLNNSVLSKRAIKNLDELANRDELKDQLNITIIDISDKPELAEQEKIMAIPVLIKKLPEPVQRIIGDLSDTDKVLFSLNMHLESE